MAGEKGAANRPLVVVTGAAGRVGQLTLNALSGSCRLRLVDLDGPELAPELAAERVTADLRSPNACAEVVASADTVVHLAAQPSPEIEIREAVEDVAMPTANLAKAAGAAGVRRIVFASSIHAMGLYYRDRNYPVRAEWAPRPCCEYGAAKVLSENLLRLLTERTAVSVVCLRLGLTGHLPAAPRQPEHWLGSTDFSRLLHAAITAEVRYGAYFGVSAVATRYWEMSDAAAELGFVPQEQPPPIDHPEAAPNSDHCLLLQT